MVTTQTAVQALQSGKMANLNQPTGKVRDIARRMYIENPFLSQMVIAKLLKVTKARIGQVLTGLEKEREAAQKEELKRLREKYLK